MLQTFCLHAWNYFLISLKITMSRYHENVKSETGYHMLRAMFIILENDGCFISCVEYPAISESSAEW